jgi:hypothetical protein
MSGIARTDLDDPLGITDESAANRNQIEFVALHPLDKVVKAGARRRLTAESGNEIT